MFDDAAIERHIKYSVGLFLHGLLPRELTALEAENAKLRNLLVTSMLEAATLKERKF